MDFARETFAREDFARETFARETFARETFARETFARETFAREDIAHKDFERENFSKSYKMKVCRTYRPAVDLNIKCRVLFHFPFRRILKRRKVTKTNNYEVDYIT